MGKTRVGDAGMVHLVRLMPESVTCLSLAGCGLTSEGMRAACNFLESNRIIAKVYLGFNPIGDEGVVHVAKMLLENTSLRMASLGGQDESEIRLSRALNASLKHWH